MKKYLIGILPILFLTVLVSGCLGPSENTFNTTIIPANISAQDINKTGVNETTYQIHGIIQNNGNKTAPYLVITVNDSSGNLNSKLLVDIKSGERKEFNIPLNTDTKYDSYRIIVGDQNYKFSQSDIKDILGPLIKNDKGTGSGITLKGKPYVLSITNVTPYSASSNTSLTGITASENATFFVLTDSGEVNVGEWQYVDTGEVVSGYKHYYVITVVSWPDLKVIGQQTLYGSEPPSSGYGYGGDIYGSLPNIYEWINSLPKS